MPLVAFAPDRMQIIGDLHEVAPLIWVLATQPVRSTCQGVRYVLTDANRGCPFVRQPRNDALFRIR